MVASHQDDFIHGISMFNYNIHYACSIQGVWIPLDSCTATLDMLALLLSSSSMGQGPDYTSIEDYTNILNVHLTQWKSRPWELVDEFKEDAWQIIGE